MAGGGLELVVGGTRVALHDDVTIGRGAGATVVLEDPTVSRLHARISGGVLTDAGSSHGTWVNGVRVTGAVELHDGARIRLGDQELVVARRAEAGGEAVTEAGEAQDVQSGGEATRAAGGATEAQPGGEDGTAAGGTIVVPAVPGAGTADPVAAVAAAGAPAHPRLRPGYALKRLAAEEGAKRWVLRDLDANRFLRFGDEDAWLLQRLDGERSVLDLVGLAEGELGPEGPARLARLLSELGERGLLAGIEGAGPAAEPSRLRRALRPREKVIPGAGRLVEAVYRAGGRLLLRRPAVIVLGVLAAAGLAAFVVLVARVYGKPFVVAEKVGLGGLVFLLGRLAIAGVHEVAHGLALTSLGRPVQRAGLKLVLVFPYAFVDTSEAWFEPRRRRIAVALAGPVSDFALGAAFSIACLAASPGSLRDVLFNLAFAAYVGGFFNLNPFIERDGYHALVDVLDEPDLRRRAKLQLDRRLRGGPAGGGSPVLARYGTLGVAWLVVGALAVIALSLRYWDILAEYVSRPVLTGVMVTLWVACFVPVAVVVGRPLLGRLRGRGPAAAEPVP